MKKDPEIFLRHILESVDIIEKQTKTISKEKFSQNITIYKKKHKEIEWREIVGMRDKLVHEYFGVNLNIVWHTVKKDIPQLKKHILELLK